MFRFPYIALTLVMTFGHSAFGAEPEWWSFRTLTKPAPPEVDAVDAPRVQTPIDQFVIAALRQHGLTLSNEADRRTLIRRLYFDVLGLPPSQEAVQAFENDQDPKAYAKLVDQLLDSPHYGERWARHWLDVVHYGETHGYDKDKPRPNAYPYRDYVIRAFNEDKPYARFIKEQLAGDVLYPDTVDGYVATGFIAAGPWDFIGHAEVPEEKIDGKIARHLDRDDMVTTTMNAFCSLTVQCAQCHDHKRDPVTMKDYYSLQAVFAALDRADREYDADPDTAKRRAFLRAEIKVIEEAIVQLETKIESNKTDTIRALDERIAAAVLADLEIQRAALSRRSADLNSLPKPQKVYAGTVHAGSGAFKGRGDVNGEPRPIFVLNRGNVTQALDPVAPAAVPGIVRSLPVEFALPKDHQEGARRVALAEWIAHPDNTLTWRSIVNRVWHYHFGQGIVNTPNDFGRIGSEPSHPELLDWLACEFRDGGGSIKDLHRWILNSAVYKQSSSNNAAHARIDSSNNYLWRQNRRRLEAEAIRDTVLAAAGKLNTEMYGPSFMDFVIEKPEHSPHYQYHKSDPDDPQTHRRSIYRFLVRSQPQPFMDTLDCADPSELVDKRGETNTALQALAMLNNIYVVRMAEHFAARVKGESDPVGTAIGLALSRKATAAERETLGAYAEEYGFSAMCRLIFNLNEFSFVD